MANGMGPAPTGDLAGGFQLTQNSDELGISSVHKYPVEQFIHSLTNDGACLCGPDITYQHAPNRVVPLVMHYALDGDYYWSDWGEDGPELEPDFL